MSFEYIELLTNLTPSILAFSTAVTTFYKNQKNMITFSMSLIKILTVTISCLYLIYLFFYKNQESKVTSIKSLLISNILTLIFALFTAYTIYSESDEVKQKVKSIREKVKNKTPKEKTEST